MWSAAFDPGLTSFCFAPKIKYWYFCHTLLNYLLLIFNWNSCRAIDGWCFMRNVFFFIWVMNFKCIEWLVKVYHILYIELVRIIGNNKMLVKSSGLRIICHTYRHYIYIPWLKANLVIYCLKIDIELEDLWGRGNWSHVCRGLSLLNNKDCFNRLYSRVRFSWSGWFKNISVVANLYISLFQSFLNI